ncbi:hypothetical protein A3B39_03290 [Candidatus Daviesbacteria bacterium RIFCSPLOWO2_01_FULL_37_10]|nr:MAG: hypothetical protein A3B39_03290 [Candidatus Daviesbacteria bacterium RIFCSPLOWO2_01_FULL_37_10]
MAKLPETKGKKVTNFILLALEKAVDGYVRFEDFTYHHYQYIYGIQELKKASLSKALQRLRQGGIIELIDDEQLIYRLTDKGREKAILAELQSSDGSWDGKWRIVIFDIPEKRRAVRDLLRHNLKSWGFEHWQKSVWVSKKNCTNALRKYISNIGMENWVLVLETDNIGR